MIEARAEEGQEEEESEPEPPAPKPPRRREASACPPVFPVPLTPGSSGGRTKGSFQHTLGLKVDQSGWSCSLCALFQVSERADPDESASMLMHEEMRSLRQKGSDTDTPSESKSPTQSERKSPTPSQRRPPMRSKRKPPMWRFKPPLQSNSNSPPEPDILSPSRWPHRSPLPL